MSVKDLEGIRDELASLVDQLDILIDEENICKEDENLEDITIHAGMRFAYLGPGMEETEDFIVAECASHSDDLCLISLKDGSVWSDYYVTTNMRGDSTLRTLLREDFVRDDWERLNVEEL